MNPQLSTCMVCLCKFHNSVINLFREYQTSLPSIKGGSFCPPGYIVKKALTIVACKDNNSLYIYTVKKPRNFTVKITGSGSWDSFFNRIYTVRRL